MVNQIKKNASGYQKILLINPPSLYSDKLLNIPLGLSYLGAVLKEQGYDVKIKDLWAYSNWQNVYSVIKNVNPDIVGISCHTLTRNQTITTAKIVKEYNPDIKVILGGPHATFYPEHMFKSNFVDIVIRGEGEITIVEVLDSLKRNKKLFNVPGIAFQSNERIINTEPRHLIKNLDSVPFPMYDDFDLRKYDYWAPGKKPRKFRDLIDTSMSTSRGCPFACVFCSVSTFWGRYHRFRSAINVVDEIQWLSNDYNIKVFHFTDDCFTANRKRVIEMCKEIVKRKLDIHIDIETRVDCIDKETLGWLQKAGCFHIVYGIESGSPKILKTIRKGFTVKQIKDGLKMTHDQGISTTTFLMVGNQGETKRTIGETITLINEIKPHRDPSNFDKVGLSVPGASVLCIYPNTPLYEISKKQGLITDNYWLSNEPTSYYTAEHSLLGLIFLKMKLEFATRPKTLFIKSTIQQNFIKRYKVLLPIITNEIIKRIKNRKKD